VNLAAEPARLEGVDLEHRPCPHGCSGGDDFVVEGEDRLHGLPGRFRIVRCRTCALMRTEPRPTPQTIGAYYPDDYGPYQSTPAPVKIKPQTWHRRFKARLNRWLGKDVRRLPLAPPGHLVEVGCASGAWIAEQRARGWSVEGLEFSESAANTARSLGLVVQTGTVESAAPPQQKADVLAAWMVLEHLHEPLAALRKLRDWVKPGGYLVAAVPDAGALERRVFGEYWYGLHLPAHLYHYTPVTMRRLLAEAGWEVCGFHWQPNASNLLNSLEWMSEARGWSRTLRATRWVKTSPKAAKLRRRLGWLLGITRQSGRMEFHARPRAKALA
jgi:SAM-dependent methyltransferase